MKELYKTAIYPGSFDPPTNGHLDVIKRSSKLFEKLYVAVLVNMSKKPTFTQDERVELLQRITKEFENVEVITFSDMLLTDYMKEHNIGVIVKGLRAVSDFEYEFQMALANSKLNKDVETLFIPTTTQNLFLSSSVVREIARYGGDLEEFVPNSIKLDIIKKFKEDKLWK